MTSLTKHLVALLSGFQLRFVNFEIAILINYILSKLVE